jgi:hypothetical protein
VSCFRVPDSVLGIRKPAPFPAQRETGVAKKDFVDIDKKKQ